ncbi:MAG: hypothetical protein ABIO51_05000 [Solirubrobacteraceae bacterium]
MRTLLPALIATLLAAAPAAAKNVDAAAVCGADGCRDIERPSGQMVGGSSPVDGPSKGEPFVRLRFAFSDGAGAHAIVRTVFAPGSGLIRTEEGVWMTPANLAGLRAAALAVAPFPAAQMPGVEPAPARGAATAATAEPATPATPAVVPSTGGAFPWWMILVGGAPLIVAVLLARRARGRALRTG